MSARFITVQVSWPDLQGHACDEVITVWTGESFFDGRSIRIIASLGFEHVWVSGEDFGGQGRKTIQDTKFRIHGQGSGVVHVEDTACAVIEADALDECMG